MQSLNDPKLILTLFGILFALISFFYKNHETNQLRIFKNISDNVKEINKLCIDVFAMKNIENSTYHKISMHLDFVILDLKTFPTGKFYKCEICVEQNREIVNTMFEDYKDLIFCDTPIENKSLDIESFKGSEERLVNIIQKSVEILQKLESYLP